jgi:16S rRNA (cytosine967-C5)-methyltransferase
VPVTENQSARDVARAVLRRVEQGDAYATLALGGALDRSTLAGPDRAFVTELVYGVLRHRTRLDRALAAYAPGKIKLSQPGRVALRLAAYQLLVLGTPAHAAVDDAVESMRPVLGDKVAGFANALLRKLSTDGEPPPSDDLLGQLEAVRSLPPWIGKRLIAAVGEAEADAAAAALNEPAPLAVRVNLKRGKRDAVAATIAKARPSATVTPVTYLPEGLILRSAGTPEELVPFQGGLITPQDIAAQLVGRMLGAKAGERILDACAGVGGKSTHIQELAGGAHIEAADSSRRKLDLAEDSARRLGLTDIRGVFCDLTRVDAPLGDAYDRILLDAPCSGLGVLRRHPEGKWRRRDDEIAGLAELQRRLLAAVAPRVRKGGGVLVYSVCTFTREEGEGQLERFLASFPDFTAEPPPVQKGVDFAPFLDGAIFRSFPHRHDADAFFAVRLVRR